MLSKCESNDSQNLTNAIPEEPKANRDAQSDESLKNSIKTEEISPASSTLFAWSLSGTNKITIIDLETKQAFASFNGVRPSNDRYLLTRTHLKEIAKTGLLVSVHHWDNTFANLEVFDVSRKEHAKKVYSFEEVSSSSGIVGQGDVTYNPRRSILGAISVGGKISYHLYNVTSLKSGNIVKLIRKSRWHSQLIAGEDNFVTSLDFNPNGETVATIDRNGTCLLSDMNTDNYRFHLNISSIRDSCGRCRWSPNTEEPLLFVKHDVRELSILDVEKNTVSSTFEIDRVCANWIDVCQSNGNLLVSGGMDMALNIFDKREAKMVQSFDSIHTGLIFCVRWSPRCDIIASASSDKTAALLDFKTGKKIYKGQTSDYSNLFLPTK